MLTFNEAKTIGRNACIEKLGKSFYEKYKNSSTTAYGDFSDEGIAFCYVGIDDQPMVAEHTETLILSNKAKKNPIPFSASCNVHLQDGTIDFLECKLPLAD